MFTTFVVKVCAEKTAGVVGAYRINPYDITPPFVLTCKMIEQMVVRKRGELPIGAIDTFVFPLVAKFQFPFVFAYRLIARFVCSIVIPSSGKRIISPLK